MCILSLVCNGHMISSLKATHALVDDKIPGQMKTGQLMDKQSFYMGKRQLTIYFRKIFKTFQKIFYFLQYQQCVPTLSNFTEICILTSKSVDVSNMKMKIPKEETETRVLYKQNWSPDFEPTHLNWSGEIPYYIIDQTKLSSQIICSLT